MMFNDDQCNCFHQRPSSSGDVVNVDRLEPDCVQCWMGQTKAVSVISDTRPRPRVIRLQSETYQHIPPVLICHGIQISNLSIFQTKLVVGGGAVFRRNLTIAKCNNPRACSRSKMSLRLVKTLHLNKSNAPGSHQLDLSSGPVSAQSRAGPRYGQNNSSLITSYARKLGKFKTSTHHIIH